MQENANAIRLAIFTVAIYVSALTVGLGLLYYLAYVLAGVLVVAFIWSQLNKRGLEVRRKVEPAQAQVGQVVQETVELRNLTPIRKLWLEVRDRSTLPGHQVGAVVSMPGRGARRWRVRTRCVKRGLFRLGPTLVMTGDPFGLFGTSRLFQAGAELLVLPPTLPLRSFGLPSSDLPGGSQTQGRAYHSTPNAAGIREYLPGDPTNRIHWPISARTQKLMVKEFELDPMSDLWLVLDLHRAVHVSMLGGQHRRSGPAPSESARAPVVALPPTDGSSTLPLVLEDSTEEYAVAVSASLAAHFISLGRTVGLIAWGQHSVTIPADRGGRQLMKMLRALAVLRSEGDTALDVLLASHSHYFGRQDTIVVVTPSLDEKWVNALQVVKTRGTKAATVIVEPSTFGGAGNPLMVVSALTAMEVPTHLVKRNDRIDAALSETFSGEAVRHMR